MTPEKTPMFVKRIRALTQELSKHQKHAEICCKRAEHYRDQWISRTIKWQQSERARRQTIRSIKDIIAALHAILETED